MEIEQLKIDFESNNNMDFLYDSLFAVITDALTQLFNTELGEQVVDAIMDIASDMMDQQYTTSGHGSVNTTISDQRAVYVNAGDGNNIMNYRTAG